MYRNLVTANIFNILLSTRCTSSKFAHFIPFAAVDEYIHDVNKLLLKLPYETQNIEEKNQVKLYKWLKLLQLSTAANGYISQLCTYCYLHLHRRERVNNQIHNKR